MTGRRSMDKNRPAGEHNLVEWARPHLKQRQGFQTLMDPKLGGNISMKGAYKVTQLARACLARDPKARPLMSQVVEILKPLPDLKDMASSSGLYLSLQAEQVARLGYPSGSRSMSQYSSFARNGQLWMRSLSHSPLGNASPYLQFPMSGDWLSSSQTIELKMAGNLGKSWCGLLLSCDLADRARDFSRWYWWGGHLHLWTD